MRPYLVDRLNGWSGTGIFTYLVPNYLILVSLGALLGTLLAARLARKRGLEPDAVYGLAMWAFPMALIGARLAHWLHAPEAYGGSVLAVLDPLRGDSVAIGGFIAGTLTALIYLLVRGHPIWPIFDCAAPALGLATAITRIGCFLDGCDFGAVTGSPLAVAFPRGSLAFAEHVEAGLLSPAAAGSLPVHPVQIYLALKGLALMAAALYLLRSRRAAPGEAFCAFWILYAAARFGLEFLRGDAARGFIGPLSTSQAACIPIFLLALAGLWLRRRRRAPAAASA